MAVAETYQRKLPDLKDKVNNWHKYFKKNIDNFHKVRRTVFQTNLDENQMNAIRVLQRDPLEFNVLQAFVSRQLGEFSKQEPSIEVQNSPDREIVDPQTMSLIEGIMRGILINANNKNFELSIYKDILTGGFSTMEVCIDYMPGTFNQNIYLQRVYDPTLCGFDPYAIEASKADGEYCFKLYPQTLEVFKANHPDVNTDAISFARSTVGNFNFSYFSESNIPVVLVCEFYLKESKRYKLIYAADNNTYTKDEYEELLLKYEAMMSIEQPPAIVKERWEMKTIIHCYRFIETEVIEHYETDYDDLPLIFVDGESEYIRDGGEGSTVRQITKAYVQNAIGAQKMKNLAGQVIAKEIDYTAPTKFLIDHAAIPENYLETWLKPQSAGTLIYRSEETKTGRPLPPPIAVPRMGLPQEIFATFNAMDQTIQAILGSYDAALGINDNNLSGKAIFEGAMHANSAAYPYIDGFLSALNTAAQSILNLIPKYFVTPRTIPVVNKDGSKGYQQINNPQDPKSQISNIDSSVLQVIVKPGVNFEVQQRKALDTIMQLMQVSPAFNAMMAQKGLPILLDNITIRGSDQLKVMAQEFQAQQEQMQQQAQQQGQSMPPPPEVIKAQVEQQKMQQEDKFRTIEAMLKEKELEIEKMKAVLDYQTEFQNHVLQFTKANHEKTEKDTRLAMDQVDQIHQHTQDFIENELDKQQQTQGVVPNESQQQS